MSFAPKTLCLNMIVKNELANLPRCLAAVADHLACWVIADTGSTDGTQDFIRAFFAERDLPGELHSIPFVNFQQARNEALGRALTSKLSYDYLLFHDADMELVVEDPEFRSQLQAPAYAVLQRASQDLIYWNTRLAKRDAPARYHGVTHEHLDLPTEAERLHGVWYRDHACGSNRSDKYDRDAKLLTEALRHDPGNARYWFYLAQTYRDAGKMEQAATAYAKRIEMGGWVEEAWQARLQLARCRRELGDEGGFVSTALAAYDERPQRAEPLYDLARYYRTKGMHDASALFSERGLDVPVPVDDGLFVEEWVYKYGLKEEFSIAAYYLRDAVRKDRGHAVCDWLALSPDVPKPTGALARWNVFHYMKSLQDRLPSCEVRVVDYVPPEGFAIACACVTCHANRIWVLLVMIASGSGIDENASTANAGAYGSRHFLLTLTASLDIEAVAEILLGSDVPSSVKGLSVGWQDTRLVSWQHALWYSAQVVELAPDGSRQQIMAQIEAGRAGEICHLTSWQVFVAGDRQAGLTNSHLRTAADVAPMMPPWLTEKLLLAGSQPVATATFLPVTSAVAFDGGWLGLIREARGSENNRTYQHRFVWYDNTNRLCSVSRQFYFQSKETEWATGIARHPDGEKLLVSFNVAGHKPSIACFRADELRGFLTSVEADARPL